MKLKISKSLLAGLLMTSVLTVVALLKPEKPVSPEEELLVERSSPTEKTSATETAQPWLRHLLPLPKNTGAQQGFGVAPPPKPVTPPPLIPVAPPKPVVPTPAFSYLGRMIKEDHVYVFLQHGEDVEVVALGDDVDHNWRVERVSDNSVELRYLPLNETRRLAMSNN